MKNKIGTLFILIGSVFLIGALGLFLYNENEQNRAAKAVDDLMPQIVEAIRIQQEEKEDPVVATDEKEMTVVSIDGIDYIGFVGIPSLGLELPVMADWDYEKLKTAPCRFSGSVFTEDIVIMAHNYKKHFGRLFELTVGDSVTFTDMEGHTVYYEVAALDVLNPEDVDDMTAGDFDLTLFTCTYSGEARITVRCDRTENIC